MARILDILNAIGRQTYDLPDVHDPIAAIVGIINAAPDTPRSRVLSAILLGMATDREAFNESDIYALDQEARGLVILLAQDVMGGRYSRAELRAASINCGQTD